MELRQTEESLQEIQRLYESIRISPLLTREDPPVELPSSPITTLAPSANANQEASLEDLSILVQTLQQIQSTLPALETKMERFRQRLAEKDAVTGQPRYGAKTQGRVQAILTLYDFFRETIPLLSNDDNDNDHNNNKDEQDNTTISPSTLFLSQVQQRHEQQQLEQLSAQQAQEQAVRLQQEQDRQQQLLAQQQQAQQLAEQARLEQERKEAEAAELRLQAQAARERRRALEQAERDWVQQIPKGPDGVRQQLALLKTSIQQTYQTTDSGSSSNSNNNSNDTDALLLQLEQQQALETAITSLTTIFRQIHARPEDTNLRRIRRDHPQFQQDIGRFKGGVELLIAAGFELGHIDEVPVYLSKEPNLETDMDAWAAWFDRIKSTLEILEEESSRL